MISIITSYLRFQLSDFQVQLVQVFVHEGDERLMTGSTNDESFLQCN